MIRTSLTDGIINSRGWIIFLSIAVLAFACAGVGAPADGSAARQGQIWHERSDQKDPVLPKDFSPLPSLSGLVKKLKPAVVNVYTTQVIKPRVPKRRRMVPRFRDPFFEDFFGRDPFEGLDRFFGVPRREYKRNSLGTGFIVSPDGHVLTNHQAVSNASEIKVKLVDERTLETRLVGSDEKTDIALLKVKADTKLPYAYLGDSDRLEVGDWVVAIGNPFGLGHTVTTGIISGKDRVIGQGPYDDFLQTDAAINPGNSGGPLFDTAGNVVGINTAIVPHGSGIGFAVPVNLAKDLLPQLRDHGKVTRGWLGVGIQDLTEDLADQFDVKGKSGVLVSQVYEDSPADKAGLKAGDIIVAVNGKQVDEIRDVTAKIAAIPPGSSAKIEAIREGERKTFEVTLGEREKGETLAAGEGGKAEESSLGLTLSELTSQKARKLGIDEDLKGLLVEEVDRAGPTAGFIREGDVILEINRQRVKDLEDFRRALARNASKNGVLLRIQRGHSQIFVVIKK